MTALYVFDTSAWITIDRDTPRDIYETVWARIDDAIEKGVIRSPDEVFSELEQGVDDLGRYLKSRAGLFVPLEDDLQVSLSEVMDQCPTLSDPESTRNHADPFVVALAKLHGGNVVSQERSRKHVTGPMKIPDACVHFGCPHFKWLPFLREVGWRL
jgi:hypothetical protein